jgi:hypothetical protein
MSCDVTRRNLLNAERPDRPPAALRPHLAECPSCRDWLHNLTELEARVPLLPVPPSDAAKARLLKQLRETPLVPESLRVVAPELPFTPPKERGLRKLAVALALAAAVVLFAVGLSLWPRHPNAPQTVPGVAEKSPIDAVAQMQGVRDRGVAKARTPRERVEILAEFADNLLREARNPDALPSGERLEQLARVYEETVQEKLLKQARAIPPGVQRALLPRLAGDLGRTESEFSRLAAGAPAAAVHLQRIAAAAKKGNQELLRLANNANA